MKLFNVTEKEISNKLFNIFVGISLGNKLLTPILAKKYIEWAHKNTKDTALILIADEIDIINWQIFRGLTVQSSNLASQIVIEKNNGILEDERLDQDGNPFKRYWINLHL